VRQPQDAPYAGLLFDGTGTAMLPTYSVKRGGIRHRDYASRPTRKGERSTAAISCIPPPPLDAFMESVLARLALTGVRETEQAPPVLHGIEIQADNIVLRLQRSGALALWRATEPDGARIRDRGAIGLGRGRLTTSETLNEDGELLILSLPVSARFPGGRTEYSAPSGPPAARPDMALSDSRCSRDSDWYSRQFRKNLLRLQLVFRSMLHRNAPISTVSMGPQVATCSGRTRHGKTRESGLCQNSHAEASRFGRECERQFLPPAIVRNGFDRSGPSSFSSKS
jgi:hypothetical protein